MHTDVLQRGDSRFLQGRKNSAAPGQLRNKLVQVGRVTHAHHFLGFQVRDFLRDLGWVRRRFQGIADTNFTHRII